MARISVALKTINSEVVKITKKLFSLGDKLGPLEINRTWLSLDHSTRNADYFYIRRQHFKFT